MSEVYINGDLLSLVVVSSFLLGICIGVFFERYGK